MHSKIPERLAVIAVALLQTGCALNALPTHKNLPEAPTEIRPLPAPLPAPVPIPLPERIPIPASPLATATESNVSCNHQFDASQTALGPDYIETETNSIIDGNTFGGLLRSLNNAVPYRGEGNTQWTISWSYDATPGVRSCSVENAEVRVMVDYHLPMWPEQINATNRILASQWNEYSDALRAHHCRHGKTGIDAALAVKENLQQLALNGSCEQLKAEADAMARNVINGYKDAESRFVAPEITSYVQ